MDDILKPKKHKQENAFTRGVNPLCPNDSLWSARDEQSSEDEVNDFLYALVRLVKPRFVVETGAYLGDGTLAMARAIKANGVGRLVTCETVKERVEAVDKALKVWGYDFAQVIQCTGLELIKQCGAQIDFAFIDSSPYGADRKAEIDALIPFLRSHTMFALHDTAPQHEQIRQVAEKVELPGVYFNCPRGLSLFMKP